MKSAGFRSDQWIAIRSHGATRGVLFPWSAGCHHLTLRPAISGCRGSGSVPIKSSCSSVTLAGFQQRPNRSGHLVGDGDRHDLRGLSFQQTPDPVVAFAAPRPHANTRKRAQIEQFSQISVALLRNVADPLATAAGMLPRGETHPGCVVARRAELTGVRCRRADRAGGNRIDGRVTASQTAAASAASVF